MEQQHLHAKGYPYPGMVEEEMDEEEEAGLQRSVSKLIRSFSEDVGEESDTSISTSSRVIVEEIVEDPVLIQDVKYGVVNATIEEVKEEVILEAELEVEKEAETDEVLAKEVNINESAMKKAEAGFDGGEEEGEGENVTNGFNSTVHFESEKGFEAIQPHHETETSGVEKSVLEEEHAYEALDIGEEISDAQELNSSEILYQNEEISGVENLRDSKLPSFTESHEDGSKQLNSTRGIREDVDIDVIEEVCPEETEEFDVERVLEKQSTHDLFCPNCHSCITRKVILRRRKRKIRNLHFRAKYDRLDKAVVSKLDAEHAVQAKSQSFQTATIEPHSVVSSEIHTESTPEAETQNFHAITASTADAPPAPAADSNDSRGPEVFRCLSCFSFFIPTGKGFKLFKIFEGKDEAQKVTDQPEIPAAKSTLFSFFPKKKEKMTEQETRPSPVETNQRDEPIGVNENQLAQNDSASPIETSALPEQSIPSVGLVNDAKLADVNGFASSKDATSSPIKSLSSEGITDDAKTKPDKKEEDIPAYGTGETLVSIKPSSDDSSKKLYPVEVKIPPTTVTIVVGQSLTDIHHDSVEKPKELPDETETTKDKASTTEPLESILPLQGLNEVGKVEPIAEKKLEDVVPTSKGEDVSVAIERGQADAAIARQQPESTTASQEAAAPQVVIETGVDDISTTQAEDTRDWDILKSIVYGGLIESITSLGVVSSAAGGGAKTLNTLALGLANLIGGLFVIAHNLRELKESSVTSSGSTVQDRYFEQLGRRDNFCLHATVVIISFIIFGSVAPITYAFSFRESDNRDYKLAVVAAASLFCIFMLAIGKAHVRTPPRSYFKTISYYVIMGVMASGVSFSVGELVDYLLEKFGWFDSSSTVTGAIAEMGTTGSGWASY